MFNNGKNFVDYLGSRLWDSSSDFRSHILRWINDIQTDIISDKVKVDYFLFEMKKRISTGQNYIDLNISKPSTPTVAIATGGSLTNGTAYKVYTTFVLYDNSIRKYIESEMSLASAIVTGTSSDKTINITAIDTYPGDTDIHPTTIYRNIYLAKKASTDTAYGDPFYVGQITNNTTTTYSITSEPTSTVTPPSFSMLIDVSRKGLCFQNLNTKLVQESFQKILDYNPKLDSEGDPIYFDYVGQDRLFIHPKFPSTASSDNRTLSYYVYRKPHEVFYDVDRELDFPLEMMAVVELGVVWKSYEFRDRAGKETIQNNYEVAKRNFLNKFSQKKGSASIRNVNPDCDGWV
jgi:hypothetical protein